LLALLAFGKVAAGLWLLSKSLIGEYSLVIRPLLFAAGLAVIFVMGISVA